MSHTKSKNGDQSEQVLTTGQVARICRVAPRTVSKWFDSGQLRGYRIPGSKDRRIPLQYLIRFMKVHGMPLNGLQGDERRVLIVDTDADLTGLLQQTLTNGGRYEVRVAASAFEAGAITEDFHPDVMLADLDLAGIDGRTLSRYVSSHPELRGVQIIAMSASLTESDRQALIQQGFDNAIAKPFSIREVSDVIERALALSL